MPYALSNAINQVVHRWREEARGVIGLVVMSSKKIHGHILTYMALAGSRTQLDNDTATPLERQNVLIDCSSRSNVYPPLIEPSAASFGYVTSAIHALSFTPTMTTARRHSDNGIKFAGMTRTRITQLAISLARWRDVQLQGSSTSRTWMRGMIGSREGVSR